MEANFPPLGSGLQVVDRWMFYTEIVGRLRKLHFPDEILNSHHEAIKNHSDDLWYNINDQLRRAPGALEMAMVTYGNRSADVYTTIYGSANTPNRAYSLMDTFTHFLNHKYHLSTKSDSPPFPGPVQPCYAKETHIKTQSGLIPAHVRPSLHRTANGEIQYYGAIRCPSCFPSCQHPMLYPLLSPTLHFVPEPGFDTSTPHPRPVTVPTFTSAFNNLPQVGHVPFSAHSGTPFIGTFRSPTPYPVHDITTNTASNPLYNATPIHFTPPILYNATHTTATPPPLPPPNLPPRNPVNPPPTTSSEEETPSQDLISVTD